MRTNVMRVERETFATYLPELAQTLRRIGAEIDSLADAINFGERERARATT